MKRVLLAAAAGALATALPAAGEEFVVDLSGSMVAITTGFVGSDLLLFGATEGEETWWWSSAALRSTNGCAVKARLLEFGSTGTK